MSEQHNMRGSLAVPMALSLGHTTLEANGLDGNPVITGNYVSPQYELPLPWPDGDWYLRQAFVPAVQAGETVICNTLIPGLRDHYQQIGLLPLGASVIEVEPDVAAEPLYGFPYTDPLMQMGVSIQNGRSNYLCATFSGDAVAAQATAVGLETITCSSSEYTNNKTRLRQAADRYGITMLPGATVSSVDELPDVLEGDWNTNYGSWLKLATGSGGDLVRYLPGLVTEAEFYEAVQSLRNMVKQAFNMGSFAQPYANYWPDDSLSPGGYPLVLEADASIISTDMVNGSTQFITDHNGKVQILGHFSQMTTSEGEYLGNEPFVQLSEAAQDLAKQQAWRAGKYNIEAHGYFGIQAIDWFVLDGHGVTPQLFVGELNSRPTANTPPLIIAQKLDAGHFLNTNVYTDTPVEALEDFVAIVGEDFAYGEAHEGGVLVPQAFRTMVTRETIFASPNFKAVLLADSAAGCRRMASQLVKRGVRFQP